MKHGDAERIARMCELHNMRVMPWQRRYLAQLEQHHIDIQFAEMVRGFNR